MLPEKTTTVESFIQAGKGVSISYFSLSFIDMVSNGSWITILNVINDYIPELLDDAVTVELTAEQQQVYFYKPKLLCYDIYGNPELYFVILLMNDMADVKEFTETKIKMLTKSAMNNLISLIYNAEKTAMKNYNSK